MRINAASKSVVQIFQMTCDVSLPLPGENSGSQGVCGVWSLPYCLGNGSRAAGSGQTIRPVKRSRNPLFL